jgi:hypothetical protein
MFCISVISSKIDHWKKFEASQQCTSVVSEPSIQNMAIKPHNSKERPTATAGILEPIGIVDVYLFRTTGRTRVSVNDVITAMSLSYNSMKPLIIFLFGRRTLICHNYRSTSARNNDT